MIPSSVTTRRTSNRVRKTKRAYSPSVDDDSPVTSRKIRKEPHGGISLKSSRSLSSLSADEVVNDKEHSNIIWSQNSFWNFAATLSNPIVSEKIAGDKVVTLLLNEISRATRQLIAGAKHVMQQAGREKLLCDDLNTFIGAEGGKSLFGFSENNQWQKIGDVFVPKDEILDLRLCCSSVQFETFSG